MCGGGEMVGKRHDGRRGADPGSLCKVFQYYTEALDSTVASLTRVKETKVSS